jgi:hypothetical protein
MTTETRQERFIRASPEGADDARTTPALALNAL